MASKKTDRTKRSDILSVGPVTSKKTTGHTMRQPNARTIMLLRVKQLTHNAKRAHEQIKRLNAAIKALGKLKETSNG